MTFNIGGTVAISIHAPRGGERLLLQCAKNPAQAISIHAPRGGSDCGAYVPKTITNFISIHAPRGGSDALPLLHIAYCGLISIHAPRGGSDKALDDKRIEVKNFNPRSPRGERLYEVAVSTEFL